MTIVNWSSLIMEADADKENSTEVKSPTNENGGKISKARQLPEEQVNMFREVFEMLDSDHVGTLDVTKLYNTLQVIDPKITEEEANNILQELDEDGDGKINFEDFLGAMTNTQMFGPGGGAGHERRKGKSFFYSNRQRLFVSAITRFAANDSYGEIDRFYANKMKQAPHVLSCYTAGARLIGMSEQTIMEEIKRILRKSKNPDSPYSQPLPFVSSAVKPKKKKKLKKKDRKDSLPVTDKTPEPSAVDSSKQTGAGKAGKPKVGFTADADALANIKEEPAENVEGERKSSPVSKDSKKKSKSKKPRAGSPLQPRDTNVPESRIKKDWIKLDRKTSLFPMVDLSSAKKTKGKGKGKFTFEDLPIIRKRFTEAVKKYYSSLRKEFVQQALEQWDEVHAKDIYPRRMRERFRTIFEAYIPHKEEDVFVIAPWIPGPIFTSHYPRILSQRPYSCPPTLRSNVEVFPSRRPCSGR